MNRDDDYETVYSLLVALCDHDTYGPPADLLAAFNLFADAYTPRELRPIAVMSYDRMLADALTRIQDLSAVAPDLANTTRLLTVCDLIAAAMYEPGSSAGRPA